MTDTKPNENLVSQRSDVLENIEIDSLCDVIYKFYGFDFREYAISSLKRRINNFLQQENVASISLLQERILYNKDIMERFLLNLSINVTAMFRDPSMYASFRKKVAPILLSYPSTRVWHAGCSSGEEVFSTSILFHEENLAQRSTIYATDFNETIINKAQKGIVPLEVMREYTDNYQKSGGTSAFSEYYTAQHNNAIISPKVRKHIVYSRHNLVTDGPFNQFNVILCRNVMIYFNEELRNKVLMLLHKSLCQFGILILGMKETLQFTPLEGLYKELDAENKIYQRLN